MNAKDYATLAARPEYAGMTMGELYEVSEDIPSNPTANTTIGDVIAARLGRRDLMGGLLATTAIAAYAGSIDSAAAQTAAKPTFSFTEIEHGVDEKHHVAPGYTADILIRWGDPLFTIAADFDPANQTGAKQLTQFGYNCDYVGLAPLPMGGKTAAPTCRR